MGFISRNIEGFSRTEKRARRGALVWDKGTVLHIPSSSPQQGPELGRGTSRKVRGVEIKAWGLEQCKQEATVRKVPHGEVLHAVPEMAQESRLETLKPRLPLMPQTQYS